MKFIIFIISIMFVFTGCAVKSVNHTERTIINHTERTIIFDEKKCKPVKNPYYSEKSYLTLQLQDRSNANLNRLKFVQNDGSYLIIDDNKQQFGTGVWEDEYKIRYQIETSLGHGQNYSLTGLEVEYWDEYRNDASEYEKLLEENYIEVVVELIINHDDDEKTIYPDNKIVFTGTHAEKEMISGESISTTLPNHYKHEPCLFNAMRVLPTGQDANPRLFRFTFGINEFEHEGYDRE